MRGSKGSALLNAIVVAGVVAAVSGIIMTQTKTTDESSRAPRIRSAMAVMQARVQALANQASSYKCDADSSGQLTLAQAHCDIDHAIFDNLQTNITGAKCTTSGGCGVKVSSSKFNISGTDMVFTAVISYQGTEVPIAPVTVSMKIPTDILATEKGFTCPLATPIFLGYNPNGSINCTKLPEDCTPPGPNIHTQGRFIVSLDQKTLQPVCNDLGTTVACPADSYLSNYKWNGAGFTITCAPRNDPFVSMAYSPVTGTPGAIIDPPIYSSTTTSTSTTTSSSTSTTTTLLSSSCCEYYTGGGWKDVTFVGTAAECNWTKTNIGGGDTCAGASYKNPPPASCAGAYVLYTSSGLILAAQPMDCQPFAGPATMPGPGALTCCGDGVTGYIKSGVGYTGGNILTSAACAGTPGCVCNSSFSCCVKSNGVYYASLPGC